MTDVHVSIVVFLFIQITASKLNMSDFRLSTFTVLLSKLKYSQWQVGIGSIRGFRFVYHARDEGTQNPWRITVVKRTVTRVLSSWIR